MPFFIFFLVSLFSALLVDVLPVIKTGKKIFIFQKSSISVITNLEMSDKEKQQSLLLNAGKIGLLTLKLTVLLIIVLLPFAGYLLTGQLLSEKAAYSEKAFSYSGLGISCLAFLVYYLIKKGNERFRL